MQRPPVADELWTAAKAGAQVPLSIGSTIVHPARPRSGGGIRNTVCRSATRDSRTPLRALDLDGDPGTLILMPVLLALLLSVVLGAPFGEAEAQALEVDTGMTIEVSVELESGQSAVLARVVAFAGELPPVALVDQGDGRWVGILRLSGREDVQVAFEAIDADGSSEISELSTLTDLGVDPAVVSPTRPTTPPTEEPEPNWWLLGGAAAGIAALVLLVMWSVAGATDQHSGDDETTDADEREPSSEPEAGQV